MTDHFRLRGCWYCRGDQQLCKDDDGTLYWWCLACGRDGHYYHLKNSPEPSVEYSSMIQQPLMGFEVEEKAKWDSEGH